METTAPPFAKSRVSPQHCGLLLESGHGVKFLLVGTDVLSSRPSTMASGWAVARAGVQPRRHSHTPPASRHTGQSSGVQTQQKSSISEQFTPHCAAHELRWDPHPHEHPPMAPICWVVLDSALPFPLCPQ